MVATVSLLPLPICQSHVHWGERDSSTDELDFFACRPVFLPKGKIFSF